MDGVGVPATVPESLAYKVKRWALGKPLVSERLHEEKLSRTIATGVLSVDCISSSAYGTEEMLQILVPYVGLAAFTLVIPVTLTILAILAIVTLSYREVVSVFTKSGGSYVVSRDNFGTMVAQVAAAALIIDYSLTVAVQTVAGADALSSVPAFGFLATFAGHEWSIAIFAGLVLAFMGYANLRGLREAGRMFAFPTYFYVATVGSVVAFGVVRGLLGQLHPHAVRPVGGQNPLPFGHSSGFIMGATLFVFLKALANGGASLTGLETVSNGIAAFRPPVVKNARFVLAFLSIALGTIVLGTSLIAHWTHPVPYASGNPTVNSQIFRFVLGNGTFGRVFVYIVQIGTAIILFTGGNTSFNGFPYLASFVAEDSFLPRWFMRRGHRLVFSGGIIVLTAVGEVLIFSQHGVLDKLIALYAMGVFTGFAMAGAGMSKHHLSRREPGWRHKLAINGTAAVMSAVVVVVFAVTKFTQGAWLVVVLMPLIIFFLIRLHRQYEVEAVELERGAPRLSEIPVMRRHTVVVMVGELDLATLRALRYGRSLNPDEMHAVHFVIDAQKAAVLVAEWRRHSLTRFPLEMVQCPDRRLVRSSIDYCAHLAHDEETQVSVLLPRRFYARAWSRLLHDRTADEITEAVALLPNVNATIIPFHLGARALPGAGENGERTGAERRAAPAVPRQHHPLPGEVPSSALPSQISRDNDSPRLPAVPGSVPIGEVRYRQMVTISGHIWSVQIQPWSGVQNLECTLADETGALPLVFVGRWEVAGLAPGAALVARGRVGNHHGRLAILNPEYEFLAPTP